MRYLIGSEHGWLVGFGFGASALHLVDRNQWIGWDAATRRKQLHGVVGMSRFLIRQSVSCQNLASHVLGMVLRRVGADYEAQYGYRPWLVESFVDTENFVGTSYKAANWLEIGKTKAAGSTVSIRKRRRSRRSMSMSSTRMCVPECRALPNRPKCCRWRSVSVGWADGWKPNIHGRAGLRRHETPANATCADWGKTGETPTLLISARSKVARCWASRCSA